MATLHGIIEEIDALVENDFSDEQKTKWLDELERKIFANIMLVAEVDYTPLVWDEHNDIELFADAMHDEIYVAWLAAQIYLWQREFPEYDVHISRYGRYWDDYSAFIAHNYEPANYVR